MGGILQTGASETAAKSVTPCFTLVSDYTHIDTSSYLIITNLHTELKPQVHASHDINSLAFTMLFAHRLVTEAPRKKIFRPPLEKCGEPISKLLDIV